MKRFLILAAIVTGLTAYATPNTAEAARWRGGYYGGGYYGGGWNRGYNNRYYGGYRGGWAPRRYYGGYYGGGYGRGWGWGRPRSGVFINVPGVGGYYRW
ncbi:MAG: hypothetical protein KF774_21785 [Planctomyces sp.]|nr:hypothetical protein [Planctomyces sp.]